METNLITVPMFTFYQEDSDSTESPVNVSYYNNCICLEQGGQEVILNPNTIEKLFKSIRKNRPEAEKYLEKRNV